MQNITMMLMYSSRISSSASGPYCSMVFPIMADFLLQSYDESVGGKHIVSGTRSGILHWWAFPWDAR